MNVKLQFWALTFDISKCKSVLCLFFMLVILIVVNCWPIKCSYIKLFEDSVETQIEKSEVFDLQKSFPGTA